MAGFEGKLQEGVAWIMTQMAQHYYALLTHERMNDETGPEWMSDELMILNHVSLARINCGFLGN